MNKKLRFALALTLALTLLLPQYICAAGRLTVTSVSGKRGEQVAVEVCLTGDDVCSGNFNIRFDSDSLQLVSAAKGDGSWFGSVNEKEAGLVRVSFAQTEPLTDAVLCRLIFQVTADTPAQGTTVSIDSTRLYNAASKLVDSSLEFGTVTRDCAWFTLACGDTVEGQSVRAEISMIGTLQPCGGNFTLTYDANVLRATGVLALNALNGRQMTYNLEEEGVVRIAFAGDQPVKNGKLCAVIFQAIGTAGSTTELELTDIRAYDENSNAMDTAVSSGWIDVVIPSEADPKLWVVGGSLNDDGTASASILLQGRGEVCGGQFSLTYDPSISVEIQAESGVEYRQEAGVLHVSWASETPSVAAKTLITIHFSNAFESELTFGGNVRVYDSESKQIGVVDIRSGAITAAEQVHLTVDDAEVVSSDTGSEVSVSVDLADANFFTEEQVSQVTPMLALYHNGRLLGITVASPTALDNGIAEVSLSASADTEVSGYTVFVAGNTSIPLCTAVRG
jgi:hypothetical protein